MILRHLTCAKGSDASVVDADTAGTGTRPGEVPQPHHHAAPPVEPRIHAVEQVGLAVFYEPTNGIGNQIGHLNHGGQA